jgi:hypothetical protein
MIAWPPSGVVALWLSATACPPSLPISSATVFAGAAFVPSPVTIPPMSLTTMRAARCKQQRVLPAQAAAGAADHGTCSSNRSSLVVTT